MEVADIVEKKFDKGFNGYKMEEVDDFLQEVSAEFANLKKQNQELEKKMEVLADKIREYRNDEDAIKEALLGAQKQSGSILSSAKEKSEKMISDAKEKSEKMIAEAESKVKERGEYAKKLVDDANADKEKIIAECAAKAAQMKADMDAENQKQESIIARTRDESNAFIARLNRVYQEHMEKIGKIPIETQNDFVKSMKNTIVPPPEPKEQPKPVKENKEGSKSEDKTEKTVKNETEEIKKDESEPVLEKTSEIELKPAFSEDDSQEEKKNEASPFFDKTKHKPKYEKLEFGSNNKNK